MHLEKRLGGRTSLNTHRLLPLAHQTVGQKILMQKNNDKDFLSEFEVSLSDFLSEF